MSRMHSWRNSWDTNSWKICGFQIVDIKSKYAGMKSFVDFFFHFVHFGYTFLIHVYDMWSINVYLLKYKNLLSLSLLVCPPSPPTPHQCHKSQSPWNRRQTKEFSHSFSSANITCTLLRASPCTRPRETKKGTQTLSSKSFFFKHLFCDPSSIFNIKLAPISICVYQSSTVSSS